MQHEIDDSNFWTLRGPDEDEHSPSQKPAEENGVYRREGCGDEDEDRGVVDMQENAMGRSAGCQDMEDVIDYLREEVRVLKD